LWIPFESSRLPSQLLLFAIAFDCYSPR
jgi:hypothetical protein